MKVIEIRPATEATKSYSPCNFYIGSSLNGDIVMSEGSFGFDIRKDMTVEKLRKHLENMVREGFSVNEYELSYLR